MVCVCFLNSGINTIGHNPFCVMVEIKFVLIELAGEIATPRDPLWWLFLHVFPFLVSQSEQHYNIDSIWWMKFARWMSHYTPFIQFLKWLRRRKWLQVIIYLITIPTCIYSILK